MDPSRKPNPDDSGFRSASMLLAIPTLLLVSPLVGFFLGRYGDTRFRTTPWLSFAGMVLGFIAAGREIYFIIRRVQAEEEGDKRR